jgi:hypothetical protein
MSAAGDFKKLTAKRPEDIGRFLNAIPLLGSVTLEAAHSYLEGMLGLSRVGIGAATRLLSVKRPDLFLPANNANKKKILAVFGRHADSTDKYLRNISEIWSYPWFVAPQPDDATEHRIWRVRVALLDAILYKPV